MLDQLQKIAQQKLMEQFIPNSLDDQKTQEVTNEGTNFIMQILQDKIASGGLTQVMALFKGQTTPGESPIAGELVSKLTGLLMSKGMDGAEAKANAASAVPAVLNTLKDKFLSPAEEDKDFDLGQLESMVPANAKGVFGALKGFLGK